MPPETAAAFTRQETQGLQQTNEPRRGAGSHGGLSGHLSLWMGGQVKSSDSSASPASLLLKRAQAGGSDS